MAKFVLGQVVMTRGVADSGIEASKIHSILDRHSRGDWGNIPQEDKEMNDMAVSDNWGRKMSSYMVDGEKLWVITEADGSATTVLYPSEY